MIKLISKYSNKSNCFYQNYGKNFKLNITYLRYQIDRDDKYYVFHQKNRK